MTLFYLGDLLSQFPIPKLFCFMQWFCFLFGDNKCWHFSTLGDVNWLERFCFHLINNNIESAVNMMCLFTVWGEAYQEVCVFLSKNWGFQLWGARNNLEVWLNCTERYLCELPFFPFNHNKFLNLCHES